MLTPVITIISHMTNLDEKARALLGHLDSLPDFSFAKKLDYGNYQHMGATLSAAILQAGLNWRTVVEPRVERIRRNFPEAATTSGFVQLLRTAGYREVLEWNDEEKPNRIIRLAERLQAAGVESESDLKKWLSVPANEAGLLDLNGIGNKTVDFLCMLAGIPTNAVDRYLFALLAEAGIQSKDYLEAHGIIDRAADLGEIDRTLFDFSLWSYMAARSKSQRGRNRKKCE